MTGDLAILAAVALLMALRLVVVVAWLLRRREPQRWQVDATLTRQHQHDDDGGAATDHYELVGELRPPDSGR